MKLLRLITPVAALSLLLGGTAAASLDQVGPSSDPHSSGPIVQRSKDCSKDAIRSSSGAVLGTAESCVFVYRFETSSELDLQREYGAAWLQARFVPASGWCATDLATKLEVNGGRRAGISQNEETGRTVIARLEIDAAGNAIEPGRISQDWTASPGSLKTEPMGDDPGVRSTWQGKSSKGVNLASGLGYSWQWNPLTGGQPTRVGFGFSKLSLVSC